MILFLDEQNQRVIVYTDKGRREVYFSEINALADIVGNDLPLYVTAATEVEVSDVVSLVYQITGQQESILDDTAEDTRFYLWSNNSNKLIVEDANLIFEGKTDFKLYDANMKQRVSESLLLTNLVKKGKIQIVGESKKRVLLREATKERDVTQKEKQGKIDKSLDSIILDKPVADFDPDMDSDMIGMDITDEVTGRKSFTGGAGGISMPNESEGVV